MFQKTFSTERLSLQRINLDDTVAVYKNWASDPLVTRYLIWRPHKSVSDTYRYIKNCLDGWKNQTEFTWLIFEKKAGEPIGAFAARPFVPSVEIGFVLSRLSWNKGYMTEVVRNFIDYIISIPEFCRVWAVCDIENAASERVLIKSGMNRECILKSWATHPNISDKPRDCLCYSYIKVKK
jgi:ribosomal-protein-alanine N-acetyltransferase